MRDVNKHEVNPSWLRRKFVQVSLPVILIVAILLTILPAGFVARSAAPKYILLFVGDGMGFKHLEATNLYLNGGIAIPRFQTWSHYALSTYPEGGSYDPAAAWASFDCVNLGATDSAAAATALFSGQKTSLGKINVNSATTARLESLAELAHQYDLSTGMVTSVYLSHATPAAWLGHNDARANGYALADENLWGDPNTTGLPVDPYYGGGHGITLPPADVALGAGHPYWNGASYLNTAILGKLRLENSIPGHAFVERSTGQLDGGSRLLEIAATPSIQHLTGLFGGLEGNLEYRLADGSGANLENPTLAQMTQAALTVLGRDSDGFVLMVEGGAIDWASHSNNMDRMIGETLAFYQAIQTGIDWIEDPATPATWENTLVVVTADHETGYLARKPGQLPNLHLGTINATTLALEKMPANSNRRASWEDLDGDQLIDAGETVYWAWNSGSHTNSLVPLYYHGAGASQFADYIAGQDPVYGSYLDNTSVYIVLASFLETSPVIPTPTSAPAPTPTVVCLSSPVTAQANRSDCQVPSNRILLPFLPH